MKKIFMILSLIILSFFIPNNIQGVFRQNENFHSYLNNSTYNVNPDQLLKHFMIDLMYNDTIIAIQNYYGVNDLIALSYNWNRNVVEIIYPQEVSEYQYIVKITVIPTTDKPLGIDTLTFGVQIKSYPNSSEQSSIESNLITYENRELEIE